ncbi:hypothetical protein LCGC14_2505890 [marine sediment metagenome]|uniref:Uncharacterized protein n=1 Tax=marine sediment metagenome TaxID=412755 RepID=A0A0F9B0I0_9ZZZZ
MVLSLLQLLKWALVLGHYAVSEIEIFGQQKGFQQKKEALDYGIKMLEKDLQDALDQLSKPKYQKKPKPVDAVQWNGEEIKGARYWNGSWDYNNQPIEPGEWIVSGKVVTNEDFEQDYEVVT